MSYLNKIALAMVLISASSTPSLAFFDGLTSVTNNLIDSTESVTNNTINNATTTVLSLSSNPGKMADRIGQMADRIGYMGDRIVTTEGIVAGVAHKMLDTAKPVQQPLQQTGWGYAPVAYAPPPAGYRYNAPAHVNTYGYGYAQPAPLQQVNINPYMPYAAPAQAHSYGYSQPGNERYSASNMIFGVPGATYTAARQTPPAAPAIRSNTSNGHVSGYDIARQPIKTKVSSNCGYAYGVPLSCR